MKKHHRNNSNPFDDIFEDGEYTQNHPMLAPTGYPAMDEIDATMGQKLILHAGPTKNFPGQKIYTLTAFANPETGLPALETRWGLTNAQGEDIELVGEILDPNLVGIIFRPLYSIFGEGGNPTSH